MKAREWSTVQFVNPLRGPYLYIATTITTCESEIDTFEDPKYYFQTLFCRAGQHLLHIPKHLRDQHTAYDGTLDSQFPLAQNDHTLRKHMRAAMGCQIMSASVLPWKQVAETRVAAEHLLLYAISQHQSSVQCARCPKQLQTQLRLQC